MYRMKSPKCFRGDNTNMIVPLLITSYQFHERKRSVEHTIGKYIAYYDANFNGWRLIKLTDN